MLFVLLTNILCRNMARVNIHVSTEQCSKHGMVEIKIAYGSGVVLDCIVS